MSGDGFGVRGQKQNIRRYTGGGVRPDRADAKREEAKARQEAWSKLAPELQLRRLDEILGKGLGAKRQRARLQALVAGQSKQRKDKRTQA